jgi:uncharacterized membrane protein YdjX (TVP38/TMEM64 family)
MMFKPKSLLFAAITLIFSGALVWFFGNQFFAFFSLDTLKCYAGYLMAFARTHYYTTVLLYLAIGIGGISLFLPMVTLYMITAGFLFGPWEGAFYAVLGSTVGALCAFLLVRATIGPWVQKYEQKLVMVNQFIKGYGFYALMMLRMSHLVPFFLLNIAAALMPISLTAFAGATLMGVIPSALLFAWTGQYLCSINSVWDLVNFHMLSILAVGMGMLLCFVLVGSHFMRRRA